MTTFGPYTAQVAHIHDGDTIDIDIALAGHLRADTSPHDDLGFAIHHVRGSIILRRQAVRLFGCNAPELATTEGKLALAFLQGLVKAGDTVELLSHGWDKYGGRIDGSVKLADGTDLSAAMIAAGHAAPWDGKGTKPVPATDLAAGLNATETESAG